MTASPLVPGAVYWADLGDGAGREQAGLRPCLVVSSSAHIREVDSLTTVMPCTGRARGWINHVPPTGHVELPRTTYVMTEQVRTISRERLLRFAGLADGNCLTETLGWFRAWTPSAA